MPIQEHELFKAPSDPGAPLFRYMDLAKFVSLLERRALFFARSDRLGDAFEGSMPRAILEHRSEFYQGIPEASWREIDKARRKMRLRTFINCWTASPTESNAMWRLYVGDGNGLAIESSYERLVAGLGGEQHIFVGMVRYDWEAIPEKNLLAPFLFKRAGFEYERELRAIVQVIPVSDGTIVWSRRRLPALSVPVDVPGLVRRVRLSPFAEHWYQEVVESVIARYGYELEVAQSDLAGDPVF